jgi:hypothetical protein
MKKLIFIFLMLVMLVGSVYAVEHKLKLSPQMYTVMNRIEVTYPFDGEICAINQPCSIIWVTNLIKNYPTVWAQIVWPDGTPTAGSYPLTNNGQYNWVPDSSFWDESVRCKEYRVKIYTSDNKYKGMSGRFKVGQTLGHCP